jgi:solute carrier family 35 protein F5
MGILVLLVVDFIWVAAAVISEKLFKEDAYPKPLFSVYFKTSLFVICLFPFTFWRPWHRLCCPRKSSRSDSLIAATLSPPLPVCTRKSCLKSSQNSNTNHDSSHFRSGLDEHRHSVAGDSDYEAEQEEEGASQISSDSEPLSINEETGQTEVLGQSVAGSTEASEQAEEGSIGKSLQDTVNNDVPSLDSMQEQTQESITITEPNFEPLSPRRREEYDEESDDIVPPTHRPRRRGRVHFSQTIEVRHRKSWDDIKAQSTGSNKPAVNNEGDVLSVRATALLALVFGILWFFANYFYQLAFLVTTVGVVNTLSSLSGVFVLILAAIPVFSVADNDRITLTKIIVVLVSGGGAVLVGVSQVSGNEITNGGGFLGLAICYSTVGAFLYASYLTLLKKIVRDTDRLEIPMFFGFVGLFNIFLLFPLLVIWNYTQLETFEWPPNSQVWTLLIVNGFVGTVLSELLWLIGSFLTSPLVGTLSLALVTPFSITYDIIFEKTTFSFVFFIGAILVLVAFVCVALLEHYGRWDPAWKLVKIIQRIFRNSYRSNLGPASPSTPEEASNLLDTLNEDLRED